MVADTLAGNPITEPGALHPFPFYLSVITADNITPVQSADLFCLSPAGGSAKAHLCPFNFKSVN